MTFVRQFFNKTNTITQKTLAIIAALGMIASFTPTTASANGFSHKSGIHSVGFNGGHRGFNGGHRSFNRGHRGFNGGHRGFYGNRGYYGNRGFAHNRGFHGHNRGFGYYNGFNRHHRRGNGAAIAAGIIGFSAGAIIASEVSRGHNYNVRSVSYEPFSPAWYRACANKYRSFNPDTGKYLSYSGEYRFCKI